MNYSVIIPHKNCPELLARCIDSIPKRDDIEVVVVDDNSDCILSVMEVVASRELQNLKLVCTEKDGGAGYARNIGLEQVSGKWLLFLDADDFFLEESFEHFDMYLNSECDMVYFKHMSVYSDTPLWHCFIVVSIKVYA